VRRLLRFVTPALDAAKGKSEAGLSRLAGCVLFLCCHDGFQGYRQLAKEIAPDEAGVVVCLFGICVIPTSTVDLLPSSQI